MQGDGDKQHKNDMYGNIAARDESDDGVQPPIHAATVVLVRDSSDGPEILMLKKNSKITFGGMWVFPGGRIDEDDYPDDRDLEGAARTAAARETVEEAGISVSAAEFEWFAHWTPPPGPAKRFATWFFVAEVTTAVDIQIDDGEIKDHAWIKPADALAKHTAGEIDLVPPTWVTLYHLSRYEPAKALLEHLRDNDAKVYSTRVVERQDGLRVAMWHGDAGYDQWDANIVGERHRLIMSPDGFTFENSVEEY